jgi:ubiquinone/menaquinone biosynthesis C-methylase UbiE
VAEVWWRLVRFGFRLLYNEMAFTYDWVSYAVSLGAWRCWQRATLKHLDMGGLVLELAHGTGNLQIDLQQAGYQTIGYDLSPYMGRIAAAKLRQHNLAVRLIRGKAEQLPFASSTFTAVVSTFPTNFIAAPETLSEVHRILRPNGQFIIVPNGILTGGDVTSTGVEWLYRITGQRNDSSASIENFFQPYGFEAQFIEETCPRSIAQVIVARKKV